MADCCDVIVAAAHHDDLKTRPRAHFVPRTKNRNIKTAMENAGGDNLTDIKNAFTVYFGA